MAILDVAADPTRRRRSPAPRRPGRPGRPARRRDGVPRRGGRRGRRSGARPRLGSTTCDRASPPRRCDARARWRRRGGRGRAALELLEPRRARFPLFGWSLGKRRPSSPRRDLLARSITASCWARPAHHGAAAGAGGAGARRGRGGRTHARPRRALHARTRRGGPPRAGDARDGGEGRARALTSLRGPCTAAAARDTMEGPPSPTRVFEVRRRGAGPRRTLREVLEHVRGTGVRARDRRRRRRRDAHAGGSTWRPPGAAPARGAADRVGPSPLGPRAERGAQVAQVAAGAEPDAWG